MENNIDNKEIFFALYYNQEVLRIKGWGRLLLLDSYKFLPEEKTIQKSTLELTSLSDITDEDLLLLKCNRKVWEMYEDFPDEWLSALAFDILRSKGYALPFMGIDVESLVSWNWVKLKTIKTNL